MWVLQNSCLMATWDEREERDGREDLNRTGGRKKKTTKTKKEGTEQTDRNTQRDMKREDSNMCGRIHTCSIVSVASGRN